MSGYIETEWVPHETLVSAARLNKIEDELTDLQPEYYEQPTEPMTAEIGAIWVETDAAPPSYPIPDGAVTEPKIASGAVTESKIAAGAVTSPKIGVNQVLNTHIAAQTLDVSKLLADASQAPGLLYYSGAGAGRWQRLERRINFPTSGMVDGDEVILTDSLTAPTYDWRFRYCAAITDAYKWVFIGGSPMYAGPSGSMTINTANTWIALTGGPTLTLPRAGVFDIRHEVLQDTGGTAGARYCYSNVLAGASEMGPNAANVVDGSWQGGRTGIVWRRTGVAAVLIVRCQMSAAVNTGFGGATLTVTPVRCS